MIIKKKEYKTPQVKWVNLSSQKLLNGSLDEEEDTIIVDDFDESDDLIID